MTDWVDLKHVCFRNSFISTPIEVLTSAGHPKGSPTWVLANKIFQQLSRLIDLWFGIWIRKWLPVVVTHSSTSQNKFSSNSFISTPIEVLTSTGHPKGSPACVLANKLSVSISVSLTWIRDLTPEMTSGTTIPTRVLVPNYFLYLA